MIIRLHVILVSHIASRRLIEVDVRLEQASSSPNSRTLVRAARRQRANPIRPVIGSSRRRERFEEPGLSGQLDDDAVAHVARTRNPFKRFVASGGLVARGEDKSRPKAEIHAALKRPLRPAKRQPANSRSAITHPRFSSVLPLGHPARYRAALCQPRVRRFARAISSAH